MTGLPGHHGSAETWIFCILSGLTSKLCIKAHFSGKIALDNFADILRNYINWTRTCLSLRTCESQEGLSLMPRQALVPQTPLGPSLHPTQLTCTVWGNDWSFDLKSNIKVILDITDKRKWEAKSCLWPRLMSPDITLGKLTMTRMRAPDMGECFRVLFSKATQFYNLLGEIKQSKNHECCILGPSYAKMG